MEIRVFRGHNGAADPVDLALLNAPPDDEPETTEERDAVEAALADPAADVPFSQIRRRA